MTMDAYAETPDVRTLALARLVGTLAEDAMFALACGGGPDVLEAVGKRRGEAYGAVLAGHRLNTLMGEPDAYVVEMTRAAAPVHAPDFLPMAEVLRERVTLEAGARGLRSLFSSKPSEKDVVRVRRLGTLAVRVLRAVLAADGPIDAEEARTLSAFILSLGLPDPDVHALHAEMPLPVEQLDVYGDVEPAVAKALVRGAWHAAAADQLDAREEHVARVLAHKLAIPAIDLEALRNEVVQRVDARRLLGLATVDAVRFVLCDRAPGHGVTLAARAGALVVPRRYREEALAQIGSGVRVTLAKRFGQLGAADRQTALGIAWAAALYEDPSVARKALLRARHERVAIDLGEDGSAARRAIDDWFAEVLAPAAFPMGDGAS